MDYPPAFTSMVAPNSEAAQVKALKETFGAEPCSLADVLLLAPGTGISISFSGSYVTLCWSKVDSNSRSHVLSKRDAGR
jgi:hypothetical protein